MEDEPTKGELCEAVTRFAAAPPTVESLTAEMADARRRLRAVESVLLAKIADEFNGDPRRMARAILDYRLEARNA